MYMNVLFACMSVYHVCATPKETKRRCQMSWNWSYKGCESAMWVLGISLCPLEE